MTMASGEGLGSEAAQVEDSNKPFSIDRSCIPCVPQDDQNEMLYNLGIDIYEQDALEKEILHQVGEAFERETVGNKKGKINKNAYDKNLKPVMNVKSSDENPVCKLGLDSSQLGESEIGRKVRMGEMTPFGTSFSISDAEMNCFSKVEQYLRDQIEAERRRKELKKKLSIVTDKIPVEVSKTLRKKKGEPSPKKKDLPQKEKQNKIKTKAVLGSYISEDVSDQSKKPGRTLSETVPLEDSSGSEYVPSPLDYSDGEDDHKIPIPKKKRRKSISNKNSDENGSYTDNSDWEYSDDENPKKKSKSAKKEQDDGDMGTYLRRVSSWEKHNNREEIEAQVKTLDEEFSVPLTIWDRLFNYQKVGVQWLWELHTQRCGGILGDEMGLGKTIQVIALLAGLRVSNTVYRHGLFKGLGPVLIVSPTTIMHQWVKEFHQWWPQFRVALMHESGNYNGSRSSLIHSIVKTNGILVTSYVSCVQQKDYLTRYIWHYVILDEGHKIRNPDSQIANAVKQFRTPHRLVLSGSPMQNNLKELWSLFDYIFPGKLGTLPVFMSEFAVPITQGGYTNASQVQVATAFKCATVLRDTISPYLLRRVKADLKNHINLPLKNEQVLFCKLSDEQRNLYLEYLNSNEVDSILSGRFKVFVGLIKLRKICNHPHLFSGGPKVFKWEENVSIPEDEKYGYWKKSGKMIVVETLLKIWKKQDHRVLIFTQSRQMLAILEIFIRNQGYTYLKLDGTTSIGSRQPVISKFNEDRKYFVFLSTTRVGGLGVNLTGADRVVIYDPDWNPATDTQARERAWRIGQKNQVTIYRLITSGTIEEKIYHRQIFKQFLTNKVLKNPRQRRFFKSNDLYELFTLRDTDGGTTETSALFAGSGSEVNLRRLSRRLKSKEKSRSKLEKIKKETDATKILGAEKVEKMKKLAKILSQKLSSTSTGSAIESSKVNTKQGMASDLSDKAGASVAFDEEDKEEKSETGREDKKDEIKFETFEGELVPHLMGRLEYKEQLKLDDESRKEQDDYILGKLFSKSEISTALQHDRIMEEGPADYALVEGEAEKVAKEAVRALKESRRQYFQSLDNPGISLRRRFGSKSKKKVVEKNKNVKTNPGEVTSQMKEMSSTELLLRVKERNRLINDDLSMIITEDSAEQVELLTDIRNFISHQAEGNCRATTQEIVDRFRDRLPSGTSPIFRALLLEICEFSRNSDGKGVWNLRPDFMW